MDNFVIGAGARYLAQSVAAGSLSAREIVDAHIERIQAVDRRLNAIVVPLFESARAEAIALDSRRALATPIGPLAGVPFTVKESFDVAGTPTTVGLTNRRNHRADVDADVVARLRAAGAILLGKTNVSQLLMFNETDNPVYGRTNNPWDLGRAPGGSSGGEAAIVAACGSAFGMGSDVGGSVRLPAHACGVHAMRPTSRRLSIRGHAALCPGQEAIVVQPGPIARHVADLKLVMSVLTGSVEGTVGSNSATVPMREVSEALPDGLRVAYFTDNGVITPSPAIRRAVREAASALEARGLPVEEWRPPEMCEAWALYMGLLFADGGMHSRRALKHSEKDWRVRRLLGGVAASHGVLATCAPLFTLLGQRRLGDGMKHIGRRSVASYWELIQRRVDLVTRFMARLDGSRYDVILCPPDALTTLSHGSGFFLGECLSYAAFPVLLDMPAGVVAATRVRPGEETDRPSSREIIDRAASRVEKGSAGLPIGVQVIARPWREDVVLAVMEALETSFRQRPDYPEQPPCTLEPGTVAAAPTASI